MSIATFEATPYEIGNGCCAASDWRGPGCPHPRESHEDGHGRCQVFGCQCNGLVPHTDTCIHAQGGG